MRATERSSIILEFLITAPEKKLRTLGYISYDDH